MTILTLSEIARALNGQVAGRQVLAPGPNHSHKDRSLSVKPSTSSPKGFVVHSYAGDDWRECEEYVVGALGLAQNHWRRDEAPDPIKNIERRARQRAAEEQERASAATRRLQARRIWNSGRDPRGTVVERYLKSRALDLPDDIAGEVLRFVERCPFGEGGATAPAMVAAMRCVRSGEIKAVHRTALTDGAQKVGRKMLGPVAETAVMLDPEDAITAGLAIGEGVETVLAARQLGLRPAWALGSTANIAAFPILPGIETLTLLVENDESGASERACRSVGTRWHRAGRAIDMVRPRIGKDLNDTIRGGVAA